LGTSTGILGEGGHKTTSGKERGVSRGKGVGVFNYQILKPATRERTKKHLRKINVGNVFWGLTYAHEGGRRQETFGK